MSTGDEAVLAVLTPGENSTAAAEAQNMFLGAQLAVRDINEVGGLAGAQLRLTRYDTGDMSPANVAAAVSRLLLEGRAQAVVTGFASTSAFEAELLADAGLPYIVAEHSQQLQRRIGADPERYATVWGLIPSYDPYGPEAAERLAGMAEEALVRCRHRAFLINSDSEYSSRCAEGLAIGLVRRGWSLVGGLTVAAGGIRDYLPAIKMAKRAGADLVVSTDHPVAGAAALSRAFRDSEVPALLSIQYGPKYPEYVSLAGEAADGVVFNVLGGPIEALPVTQKLRTHMSSAFGFEPDRYGLDVYQAVQLYAEAVVATGSPWEMRAVGRRIGQLRRQMTQGMVEFDPQTHLARAGDDAVPMQWFQYHGRDKVCFAPQGLATGNFRLPPWLSAR